MWDGPLQLHVHGTYVVKNCKLVLDINRSCHRDLRNDQNGYLGISKHFKDLKFQQISKRVG